MAAITWKNVGAPNFAASNALMESGGNQMTESFQNLADQFTAEGDRRKEIATGKGKAALSGIQGLDNFAARRAQIMAGLGSNVDLGALVEAGDARQKLLQGNVLFGQNREKNQFGLDNQEEVLRGDLAAQLASINSNKSTTAKNNFQLKQDEYAASPEGIAAADKAAITELGRKTGATIAINSAKADADRKKASGKFFKPDDLTAINSDMGNLTDTFTMRGGAAETFTARMLAANQEGYSKAQVLAAKKAAKDFGGWDIDDFNNYLKTVVPANAQ